MDFHALIVTVSLDTRDLKPVNLWKIYLNIYLHFPIETKRQNPCPNFLTS